MEITMELVFGLVTALATGLLGAILKGKVVPNHLIPIQNIGIGIVSAIVAVYFGLYNDVATAIFVSLFISLGVGGGYDALKSISTTNKEKAEISE